MRYFPHRPVIVVGCHRSGTSLLARQLDRARVFMGADLRKHHESNLFFQANRRVFQAASARWDDIAPLREALSNPHFAASAESLLRESLSNPRQILRYWKVRRYVDAHRWPGAPCWGWKDPCNSVTLGTWLNLFPGARVVHIHRNGVDVANSLVTREQRRGAQSRWRSARCASLEGAYSLWRDYEETLEQQLRRCADGQLHQVRYEALLAAPHQTLGWLLEFLGVEADALPEDLGVDASRRDAFRRSPALRDFHDAHRDDGIMRRLGYGNAE